VTSVAGDQHWTAFGACARMAPDVLFVEGKAQREAREVCAGCPVRVDCLVDALDHRVDFGVWGGMTERERRALLRRHPEVTSWRERLAAEPGLVPEPGPRAVWAARARHAGDAAAPDAGRARHATHDVVGGR
jgi:WhiB family transcriptional regulator, redox-sensing transcriptional regulator